MSAAAGTQDTADPEPPPIAQKRVLVLHQLRRDAVVSVSMDEAYQQILGQALGPRLDYYSEYIDVYRFSQPEYQSAFRTYLKSRYANYHFDLIIATTTAGLSLVRQPGDDLFPGSPIVFHGGKGLTGGPNSTGVVSTVDMLGPVRIALDLNPSVTKVALVGGASPIDTVYGDLALSQLKALSARLTVVNLSGRSIDEIERDVSQLTSDTIVYYVSISEDGAGQKMLPVTALRRIAAASTVPIYGWHSGMMGYGIVGGRLFSSDVVARETAALGVRILKGESPNDIPVADIDPYVTEFDWRELKRWSLAEGRLPPNSAILFRTPTLWDRYRAPIAAGALGAGALTFMFTSWLLEHRRRRQVEREAEHQFATMTQMDRRAAIGELTASLAHELHQPLGAILRNAEAAGMILAGGEPDVRELREILDDIRRDDRRAGEIIRRMRSLLRDHELKTEAVDVNDVARETLAIVAAHASSRGVRLETDFRSVPCVVTGDPVCLEQVLLNLVLNAMESMARVPEDRRLLLLRTARSNGHVEVSVEDTGPGFSAEALPRIFEPFYTTKPDGMGMGMSIVRRIVEAHYGRITAVNQAGGGARVSVSLPLRESQDDGFDLESRSL